MATRLEDDKGPIAIKLLLNLQLSLRQKKIKLERETQSLGCLLAKVIW